MTLKKITLLILILTPVTLTAGSSFDHPQSRLIHYIVSKEKSVYHTKKLISIINSIDETYKDLYAKLKKGKKIKIYFYPAHGKLPNGKWQGGAISRRLSCTGKPEEFYSIPIARALYQQLKQNPYIEILSRKDYIKVLQGKSDEYSHAPSIKTIQDAKKKGAFMMISEHLNNVSKTRKADGLVQLRGIHISKDQYGRRYLIQSKYLYSGFLTIYNRFDASGLSRQYAKALKSKLIARGMKVNGWQHGTVGFDRFYYFSAFPFSIIYESGFISNPKEEKMLKNPDTIKLIAKAQYEAFLHILNKYFGLYFKGQKLVYKKVYNNYRIDLIKISQILNYYIGKTKTKKALFTIRLLEKKYRKKSFRSYVRYYKDVKRRLVKAERYYKKGKKYAKKRWYRTARKYFRKARWSIKTTAFYSAYIKKYNRALLGKKKYRKRHIAKKKVTRKKKKTAGKKNKRKKILLVRARKASLSRPIILAKGNNHKVRDAIRLALAPDKKTLDKLEKNFKNVRIVKYKWRKYYSKKRKRWVWYKKKYVRRVWFTGGIYIVKLNRKLQVVYAKKVSRVRLLRWKYQNQQYLKNSYFAPRKKIKRI